MFTGLIEDVGIVARLDRRDRFATLEIESRLADSSLRVGDSIAVNGACLTAVRVGKGRVVLEAVAETLSRTTIGALGPGARVNLERPLKVGGRLDGHWVMGHVDGVGTVAGIRSVGPSRVVTIGTPKQLMRHVVEKGSVAVDGVSLTVAGVDSASFSVSLVPHTLDSCTLGERAVGDTVNLETDILAKHLERLLEASVSAKNHEGLTLDALRRHGFTDR
jgi:riboflavin synthase